MSDAPFYYIYGIPAGAQQPVDIHVERVLDREALHHGSVEAHRHPHLFQLSLWQGTGEYCIEGRPQPLPDPALTIMPPGVVHGFSIDPPANAVVISVSARFIAELRSRFGGKAWDVLDEPAIVALAAEPAARMRALFEALEEETRFGAKHSRSAIGCQLQLIVILLDRLSGLDRPSPEETSDDRLLRAFLRLVDEKLRERWPAEQYVSALGTTPYLLNRATRQGFGQTVSEVIRDRALAEAKRLLLFSKASAGEVGYMLGFEDPAHFGRFFVRATGMSPAMWRRHQIEILSGQAD